MAVYGTSFDQLSDEEKGAVTKKPKPVQEEVVTDEKGRRRFHGAFTGGFSAGYFNTVGSRHGWVPQTFKSTRDKRAEQPNIAAEDYMDEEDLGEFGFAAKKLRIKSNFLDSLMGQGPDQGQLAWERSSTTQNQASDADSTLIGKLSEILRPVSDSFGVRLLKKMGWREGKGIGSKMSRRALERQKVLDAASRGEQAKFDEERVKEIETTLPNVEFAPDDIQTLVFNAKENNHGLGYNPLQESGVLQQNYGSIAKGLITSKKGKAIRGQAFGVGAFEDEDEDVYTSYDLSQYDFEIGSSVSSAVKETARFDHTFVPARSTTSTRKFFVPAKIPAGFRAVHKPIPMNPELFSSKIREVGEKLTPFQRARFLGDRDQSVMELLSEKDRKFLEKTKETNGINRSQQQTQRHTEMEPFEEEPMKAHRFKKYVHYLKRGINFPQPIEMTRLEWEKELQQFQEALTPELRALLPEVQNRLKPLAKIDFSQPIAEQLNSRFQKSENERDIKPKVASGKDQDRLEAVKMKNFGEKTRTKYEWHPAKELCVRFNVPNPYPESKSVGVAELQKKIRTSENFAIMNLEFSTTQLRVREEHTQNSTRHVEPATLTQTTKPTTNELNPNKSSELENDERSPLDLLTALFEPSDESSSESSDDENPREISPQNDAILIEKEEKPIIWEKVVTVMDLVPDDNEFGAALPPNMAPAPTTEKNGIEKTSMISLDDSSSNSSYEELDLLKESKRRSKHKKETSYKAPKKQKKKHKKEHKKNKKNKKKNRRYSSSGDSTKSEIIVIN